MIGLKGLAVREQARQQAKERRAEYLRRIDAEAVLVHYNPENLVRKGEEIIHSCLLDRVDPHHAHGDANPSACLAGDTVVHLRQGKKGNWALRRSIADIHKLWHEGVPHSYKEGKGYRQTPTGNWAVCVTSEYEKHYLGTFVTEKEAQEAVERFRSENPYKGARRYSRNVRTQSWDTEGDLYGRVGTVSDIWEAGIKPLLVITTESGKVLRCTAEHRVFSGDGWVTAGEIRAGRDWMFREGRGRDNTKPREGVPKYLRSAIGNWTRSQRSGLILPVDRCRVCDGVFPFEELELDHIVPVVEDLERALSVNNLRPICGPCHQEKSVQESNFLARPGTKPKALPDRVVSVESAPPEMTYDMEVSDWQNFTANGLVVHNSLNVDKKTYNCYSYGGGDIFWLIMKMEQKAEFYEIVPLLSPFLTGSAKSVEDFKTDLDKYFRSEEHSKAPTPRYHERVLEQWDYFHPYLKDRGISFEAAERLRLGYDPRRVRITIPHWVEGVLVGWQARAITDPRWPCTEVERNTKGEPLDGGTIPKYKNSSAFPKDTTLYNLDRVVERGYRHVIAVESPMSVAMAETLWSGDLDDPLGGVVATFSANMGRAQIDQLGAFDSVTEWYDDDWSGQRGAWTLIKGLYRRANVFHIQPEKGVDLGDHRDASVVREILRRRTPAVLVLPELEKRYDRRQRTKESPGSRRRRTAPSRK